jgi:hypothetical protein
MVTEGDGEEVAGVISLDRIVEGVDIELSDSQLHLEGGMRIEPFIEFGGTRKEGAEVGLETEAIDRCSLAPQVA